MKFQGPQNYVATPDLMLAENIFADALENARAAAARCITQKRAGYGSVRKIDFSTQGLEEAIRLLSK